MPARSERTARRLACFAAVAAAFALACSGSGLRSPRPEAEPPTLLFASDELEGDFLLRQRLAFHWDDRKQEYDAAVQSACGELTVVLFTPFETAGTLIRQRGWLVDVSGRHADELPVAPERILLDVQRTYLAQPADAPRDGRRERQIREQRIEETWADGRLIERVFHPKNDDDDRVWIHYREVGSTPSASLESQRFGYRLEVTTLSRVPVPCAP